MTKLQQSILIILHKSAIVIIGRSDCISL